MSSRKRRWRHVTYLLLWGAVIALCLVWPLTHLEAYAWSNDEGLYVQRAALANAGYPLYTDTFLNKPPLLVWILQLAFHLAGQSITVARLTCLAISLAGVIALGAVAGQLWGRWAGLASVWILLGMAEIPVRAYAVTSDLPAMAFALIALATAIRFRHTGRRVWIALSGVSYASSLLIHPLLIYIALPLAAILLLPRLGSAEGGKAVKTGWLDLVVFLGLAAALWLLVVAIIDWHAFLTWVVKYNASTVDAGVQLAPSREGWLLVAEYLGNRWALVGLTITGLMVLLLEPRSRPGVLIAGAWFIATGAILVTWSPVWWHYLLFLALPMVALGGGGVAAAGGWILARQERRPKRWHTALAALVLISAAVFALQRSIKDMPQPEGGPGWSPAQLEARAFLEARVPPQGFAAADDPLLVFSAGRLVPPELTGASYKRIRSGYLTTEDLIASVLRYRTPVVLFATGRLALLSSFEDWVASTAFERYEFDGMRAYRLDLPSSPPFELGSSIANVIILDGYDLSSDVLAPGDTLDVTLFWRRTGPIDEDYAVFVHLLDEQGTIRGQHDAPPLLGAYPTSQWEEDLLLPDVHTLLIDPAAPPDQYRLLVGMYRWPSVERLSAYQPDGTRYPNDLIHLAEVWIVQEPGSP
jgi:4-amino-4-deoxy-L-arabinose transferase-like glycosyltransferase